MKTIVAGACHPDNIFQLVDPTQFLEGAFEAEVVRALNCLFPDYLCGVFSGTFILEDDRRKSDLAMIHKNLSHWFIIEVELAGHSLEYHVLPQVRCFRFGEPDTSCVASLLRAFPVFTLEQAKNLLQYVPRYVAVISNMADQGWVQALRGVDVQHLTLSVYRDRNGRSAHELDGNLIVRAESLGFATFSAIDNSLRIPKGCGLPVGAIQILDQFGNVGGWTVRENSGVLWISKNGGPALLNHGSYVQIIRSFDGRISIRQSIY